MQKTLQSAGFLLAIAGVAGLVHHFVHWFRLFAFVARIPLLSRYDLYPGMTSTSAPRCSFLASP